MNNKADKIKELSEKYRDYTSEVLSEIVKVPSFSGEEKDVIHKLKEICEDAGFDEVYVDGIGNLVARIGSGPKKIAFDAHIDTVTVGDPQQWETDPFSGIITDETRTGTRLNRSEGRRRSNDHCREDS